MEEIKIGEYARTQKGDILRYSEGHEKAYIDNFLICPHIMPERIVKHSKKITDLIKVGDILEAEIDDMYFKAELDEQDVKTKLNNLGNKIKIISILTKEKYEINSYKVEE